MSKTDAARAALPPDLARELFALAVRAAALRALADQAEAALQGLVAQVKLVRGLPADADLALDFAVAGTLALKEGAADPEAAAADAAVDGGGAAP